MGEIHSPGRRRSRVALKVSHKNAANKPTYNLIKAMDRKELKAFCQHSHFVVLLLWGAAGWVIPCWTIKISWKLARLLLVLSNMWHHQQVLPFTCSAVAASSAAMPWLIECLSSKTSNIKSRKQQLANSVRTILCSVSCSLLSAQFMVIFTVIRKLKK